MQALRQGSGCLLKPCTALAGPIFDLPADGILLPTQKGETDMAKALTLGAPEHQAMSTAYEQECSEMLAPHLDALLDKVEAAGWDRGQAASVLMYLVAMRLKPV
jgi:hypothetical protein